LILDSKELTPARCSLRITTSTLLPVCPVVLRGGYKVQLVPAPKSTSRESTINKKEKGTSQKLNLFKRGNLMSTHPNIKGSIQLPKPPISRGITTKKIIKKA
jgi:hypothetical protein